MSKLTTCLFEGMIDRKVSIVDTMERTVSGIWKSPEQIEHMTSRLLEWSEGGRPTEGVKSGKNEGGAKVGRTRACKEERIKSRVICK